MSRQVPNELNISLPGWRPYRDMQHARIVAHAKHQARGGSMETKIWRDPVFLSVLLEEVGEVANAINEMHQGIRYCDCKLCVEHLRMELVQVGAMAAAWIDAIDEVFSPLTGD